MKQTRETNKQTKKTGLDVSGEKPLKNFMRHIFRIKRTKLEFGRNYEHVGGKR